jgi:2-dehydro-3-deoxyphosphogluconate aldolase/(4S)-4-hydroxy-2-oxoglutarate aldolase
MQRNIATFIQQAHYILPIVHINEAPLIVPTIQALIRGGIQAVEITLRNKDSIHAIKMAREKFPELCLIAGTVTTTEQLLELHSQQTNFVITPGITPHLLDTCQEHDINVLPGIATPSDILLGLEFQLRYFKFFPAEALGGKTMLASLKGPFEQVQFCATGGINSDNAHEYLALDNVFSVACSWIATEEDIHNKKWDAITQKALAARQMMGESVTLECTS